jgi:hypothetical protein
VRRVNIPARYVFALLLRFVLTAPSAQDALAQEAASFQELPTFLRVGDEVRITELSGVATQGKIVKLSESSLLLSGFLRDVSSRQVLQVERMTKDTLGDGTAAGALVGTASGAALLLAVCNSRFSPCRNHPGGVAATLGITAAIGAGIGALIDAGAMKTEIVYRASKQTSRFYVAPYLTSRSKGVQLSVKF